MENIKGNVSKFHTSMPRKTFWRSFLCTGDQANGRFRSRSRLGDMDIRKEPRDGAQRAWFAELFFMGAVKGSCAIKLQCDTLHVGAENPGRSTPDTWRGSDSCGRDVILGLHFNNVLRWC